MELALLVLGLFLLVVTPILALVAFVRSQAMVRVEIEVKRLQRRLDAALTRVAELEARLGGEAQSGAALEQGDLDAPEPATVPSPAVPSVPAYMPAPLRRYVGAAVNENNWRRWGPGVQQIRLLQ